ncbi:MAG: HNH endonuclease signature motif containing protein [Actinomycetes bacterium]
MSSFTKVCHCGRRSLPGTNRCALHPAPTVTQAERLAAQPWRAGYYDRDFARNRPLAYKRDEGRCRRCGFEVAPRAYICDHVLALSDGGTSDLDNLQTLCRPCSKIKTRMDRRAREAPSRAR